MDYLFAVVVISCKLVKHIAHLVTFNYRGLKKVSILVREAEKEIKAGCCRLYKGKSAEAYALKHIYKINLFKRML